MEAISYLNVYVNRLMKRRAVTMISRLFVTCYDYATKNRNSTPTGTIGRLLGLADFQPPISEKHSTTKLEFNRTHQIIAAIPIAMTVNRITEIVP